MKLINIKIEGVSPLLCHAFTDAAQRPGNEAVVGDRGTPFEQAAAAMYIGTSGSSIIPAPNLFRAIMDGGRFFKNGRTMITTAKTSVIPACVTISEIEIPIIHKEPWTVDTRAVRIPATGGRILRHRASFNDWELNFSVLFDDRILPIKTFRDIVDAAGARIGLGDFRPACKGPFGRFVVTRWDVDELNQKLVA